MMTVAYRHKSEPAGNMTLHQYLDNLFEVGGQRLAQTIALWQAGIGYEIHFWRRWFETKGSAWPEDYGRRLVSQPFDPFLVSLLPSTSDRIPQVMDVGAGPMTLAGTYVESRQINMVAVDPLARVYSRIIADNGVSPPLLTQFGFAEDLSAR